MLIKTWEEDEERQKLWLEAGWESLEHTVF